MRNHFHKKKPFTLIVKPEASSQGKGIFITKKLEDLHPTAHCVVQRYLRSPYLIDGFKFDLRIYVLITSCDPLKVFLYNEGLGRFATENYEQSTAKDPNYENLFVHLTNYAINKSSATYFASDNPDAEKGHKRSLYSIYCTLEKEGVDVPRVKEEIRDIILKTLISIHPELVHSYRTC